MAANVGVKVRLPEPMLAKVDVLVERGVYLNRQSFFFHASKALLDVEMARLP